MSLTRQPIIDSAAIVIYYYRIAFVLASMTIHWCCHVACRWL